MRCKGSAFSSPSKIFFVILPKNRATSMKKWILKCGGPLIFIGFAMLIAGYPSHFNDHNAYLFGCILFVVAGVVLLVLAAKRRSKY